MSRRKQQSGTPAENTEPGIWTPDTILQNHKNLTWREIIFASQVHFHQQNSPDGICRASIRRFAKKLNLPRRNIEDIQDDMVTKGLLERDVKRESGKNAWTELKLTARCYLDGQSVTETQTPLVREKQTPSVTETRTQVSLKSRHINYKHIYNHNDNGANAPEKNKSFSTKVFTKEETPPRSEKLRRSFVAPSDDEILAYAEEIGYPRLDVQRFRAFYDPDRTGTWRDGKGKLIRNWKLCVHTWKENHKRRLEQAQADDPLYSEAPGDDTHPHCQEVSEIPPDLSPERLAEVSVVLDAMYARKKQEMEGITP